MKWHLTLFLRTHDIFLRILYLWYVLIQNPHDDPLASLGNLHNMQIKSAIAEIAILGSSLLICEDKRKISTSTPMFRGALILILPFLSWIVHLHIICIS